MKRSLLPKQQRTLQNMGSQIKLARLRHNTINIKLERTCGQIRHITFRARINDRSIQILNNKFIGL